MGGVGSKLIALALVLGLAGVALFWAVRAPQPFEDVKPPEREALVEQPMQKPNVPAWWVRIDQAHGFSVYGPPGTLHRRDEGIDGVGGHFDAPNFSFGYYIGYDPQPLHADNDPPVAEEPVVIDGRQGIIQRYTYPADKVKDGRRYYSRLLLPDALHHYDYGASKQALDLYGRTTSPQERANMERMWRTIRFDLRKVKDLAPAPRI